MHPSLAPTLVKSQTSIVQPLLNKNRAALHSLLKLRILSQGRLVNACRVGLLVSHGKLAFHARRLHTGLLVRNATECVPSPDLHAGLRQVLCRSPIVPVNLTSTEQLLQKLW